MAIINKDKSNEKRDAFKRLAEHRTERAIHYIDLIGNLSNRRAYEFDDSDLNTIISALRSAISQVKNRFEGSAKKKQFTLEGDSE